MKKLLMSLALVGSLAGMSAKADSYLYWMVDQTGDTDPFSFANAVIYGVGANGKEAIGSAAAVPEGNINTDVSTTIDFSGQSWSSFLVELYAADGWMKASGTLTYSSEMAGLYQSTLAGGTPKNPAKFSTFTPGAIPEPTSGMLLLFGICGLALKRKRA